MRPYISIPKMNQCHVQGMTSATANWTHLAGNVLPPFKTARRENKGTVSLSSILSVRTNLDVCFPCPMYIWSSMVTENDRTLKLWTWNSLLNTKNCTYRQKWYNSYWLQEDQVPCGI
jgi:hypothetical protein